MGTAQIREELQHYIEEGDDRLVKMLYAVAKEYSSNEVEITEAHLEELNDRLDRYESGKMKFSSWDTVKDRIRTRPKNG